MQSMHGNSLLYFLKYSFYMGVFVYLIIFSNNFIYAQNELQSNEDNLNVTKSKSHERFVVPFSASNTDRKNPVIHTYEIPKDVSWILNIENNMTYNNSSEAKTIIKLMENKPSEKFIELALFEQNEKFWVAVNTNESGYIKVHEQDTDGWSRDEPIIVAHANNQGLTITNGSESPRKEPRPDGGEWQMAMKPPYGIGT